MFKSLNSFFNKASSSQNEQALSSAQTSPSTATRNRYELIVGLDVGTTYTKCIVRDVFLENSDRFVVPLLPSTVGRREELRSLLPTMVMLCSDQVHIPGHADFSDNSALTHKYFKPLLHQAIRDGNEHEADEQEKRLESFSIQTLLRVSSWIKNESPWKDFGTHSKDRIILNLSVPLLRDDWPDAHYTSSDRALLWRYRKILSAAFEHGLAHPLKLSPELTSLGLKNSACRSEAISNLETFVASTQYGPGFYLLTDIGGGTVDCSIISWQPQPSNNLPKLVFYSSNVIWAGSSRIELECAREFCAQTNAMSDASAIKAFLHYKENMEAGFSIVGSGINQKHAAIAIKIFGDHMDALTQEICRGIAKLLPPFIQLAGAYSIGQRVLPAVSRLKRSKIMHSGGGYLHKPYGAGSLLTFNHFHWAEDDLPVIDKIPPPVKLRYGQNALPRDLCSRFSVAYGLTSSEYATEVADALRFQETKWAPPSSVERPISPDADR